MLSKRRHSYASRTLRTAQRGVVLLITLIVLVAMTLATIALVRSVDTTNLIAGNLAFKQAATSSGDAGTEAAINWLENSSPVALQANNYPNAYSALRQDPAIGQSWDNYWTTVIDPNPIAIPVTNLTCNTTGRVCTLPTDLAGNTMSYTISRLCNAAGDPTSPATGCVVTTVTSSSANSSSQGAGEITLQYSNQIYFRITTRTVGPRNTVSYVQTIIAM